MSYALRTQSVSRRRRAFTLLEMGLVLAVMVVLAAMAWPALRGPLADQRLESSAEQVQAAWITARTEAMTTGEKYVFSYWPNTGRYKVERWAGADDELSSTAAGGESDFAPEGPSSLTGEIEELPEDVRFVDDQRLTDAQAEAFGVGSSLGDSSGAEAALPIVFHLDGSTSTVELKLANDNGRCVNVSMRGLTGFVTVGELFDDEEATR